MSQRAKDAVPTLWDLVRQSRSRVAEAQLSGLISVLNAARRLHAGVGMDMDVAERWVRLGRALDRQERTR